MAADSSAPKKHATSPRTEDSLDGSRWIELTPLGGLAASVVVSVAPLDSSRRSAMSRSCSYRDPIASTAINTLNPADMKSRADCATQT